MRAESEMYDIIIRTTESDDRVLAAYLKGSRANPNAHKDICQDFDIMYVVKETESFRTDLSWMEPFGKVILKQEQDDAFGYGERFKIQDHYDETYSWLLLFEDGNRIDIGVETLEAVQKGSNRNFFLKIFTNYMFRHLLTAVMNTFGRRLKIRANCFMNRRY